VNIPERRDPVIHRSIRAHGIRVASALLAAVLTATAQAQTRPSVAELQAQIAELQAARAADAVPGLASYVTLDSTTDPARPLLVVSGANLQVVNGTGSTAVNNGVGNLFVGYDAARASGPSTCSRSWGLGQIECVSIGGVWALNHKNGSHNLVVGDQHNYSGVASVLAGSQNAVAENASAAVVMGGTGNAASAPNATVTGGANNVAAGVSSSVSGGINRFAIDSNDWAAGGLSQPN
jgi:hypothetical protein